MQIGLIGLGKMGFNLALKFKKSGHQVLAYDLSKTACERIRQHGIATALSVSDLILSLPGRRVIWMMVPAGHAVDVILSNLKNHFHANDILIDGGNTHYKDSINRARQLEEQGAYLLDCGTCGGVSTIESGLSLTIGGNLEAFQFCEPVFKSIAAPNGYVHCGQSGNGHFVKMVHNGIEYGIMQSISEGMELLLKHNHLDISAVAKVWNHGSLLEGRLMEFTEQALGKDKNLQSLKPVANHSSEGKWPAEIALELGVPAPVITLALQMRFRSQQDSSFSAKLVSALRGEFGGHTVEKN
jgi:6-phosphogluconate dehydrogenase